MREMKRGIGRKRRKVERLKFGTTRKKKSPSVVEWVGALTASREWL